MSKKIEEKKDAAPEAENLKDQRIKDLEAKVKAGEEGALERVCNAMGIDSVDIVSKEKEKKEEIRIKCRVNYPVNINGRKYFGDVEVPYGTFQVIQQALGDRRMRLLRELTGNNFILKELNDGGYAPVLVGKINELGERIA